MFYSSKREWIKFRASMEHHGGLNDYYIRVMSKIYESFRKQNPDYPSISLLK